MIVFSGLKNKAGPCRLRPRPPDVPPSSSLDATRTVTGARCFRVGGEGADAEHEELGRGEGADAEHGGAQSEERAPMRNRRSLAACRRGAAAGGGGEARKRRSSAARTRAWRLGAEERRGGSYAGDEEELEVGRACEVDAAL